MCTSISTPLDPVDEEKLRNSCWLEAGGRDECTKLDVLIIRTNVLMTTYKKHKHLLVRKLIQKKLLNLDKDFQQVRSRFDT